MTIIIKHDAFVTDEVMQMVARERAVALSAREWKHRLAGYGYSIRDTEDGKRVLEHCPTVSCCANCQTSCFTNLPD